MSSAACKAALLVQSVTLLSATLEEEVGMGCVCVRGITDINYKGEINNQTHRKTWGRRQIFI